MTSRERIKAIIAGKAADRCGFWLGMPDAKAWDLYYPYFGVQTQEELRQKLGDDMRWFCADYDPDVYRHPEGKPVFDLSFRKTLSGHGGPFENCEYPAEIEAFAWPKAEYFDFSCIIDRMKNAGEVYRMGGMWSPFYHNMMDLFGIESYLMKMFTDPEVVHAATDRLGQFYLEANERFIQEAGDELDALFFGNDFGTQQDLICGPTQFDEFILPWFRRFTELGKKYNKQVILHSCGSVHKVIDRLIDAGVDCLHPLQALAKDMDAGSLARDFKGRISFMGGIDTQDLLMNASPAEVAAEVRRVRGLLGPRWIISSSHEHIMPNVPPQNIEAMACVDYR
jgi:uroporphyrinogen decarboxylase